MPTFAADVNNDSIPDNVGKYEPEFFGWQSPSKSWGTRVTLVEAIYCIKFTKIS